MGVAATTMTAATTNDQGSNDAGDAGICFTVRTRAVFEALTLELELEWNRR